MAGTLPCSQHLSQALTPLGYRPSPALTSSRSSSSRAFRQHSKLSRHDAQQLVTHAFSSPELEVQAADFCGAAGGFAVGPPTLYLVFRSCLLRKKPLSWYWYKEARNFFGCPGLSLDRPAPSEAAPSSSGRRYHIHTFGCQMNLADSERMAGVLENAGYVCAPEASDADVIVYNTCSIREKAETKVYSALGRQVWLLFTILNAFSSFPSIECSHSVGRSFEPAPCLARLTFLPVATAWASVQH